jgi:hypothetical protein
VPEVLHRVWAPAVRRPELSLAYPRAVLWAHLRAILPVVRLVSMVLADCMVSTVAAEPILVA